MTFGRNISNIRKSKNLTQEELAKALNISRASLGMYETDKRNPDPDMLKKFANFFDVSIDYLLDMPDSEMNIQQISEAVKDDPELLEFWDMLKNREDLQILFKQTKKLDEKGIQQIIRIIKAIEDEEDNE
jgi:transcriptional regulator with XRE-family HTH domain